MCLICCQMLLQSYLWFWAVYECTHKNMQDDGLLHTQRETLFCSMKGILYWKNISVVAGMKWNLLTLGLACSLTIMHSIYYKIATPYSCPLLLMNLCLCCLSEDTLKKLFAIMWMQCWTWTSIIILMAISMHRGLVDWQYLHRLVVILTFTVPTYGWLNFVSLG